MSGSDAEARAVWSEVDLDAIRANVRALRELAAPAELLAVVKANGYGHGAVPVARAALGAGALRKAGVFSLRGLSQNIFPTRASSASSCLSV